MSVQFNFVKVQYALFEPNLGLEILPSSGRIDDGPIWAIKIWHDPLLSPENLTMPTPEWEKRGYSGKIPETVPFSSKKSFHVTDLFGDYEKKGTVFIFRQGYSDHSFWHTVRKLLAVLPSLDKADIYELIYRIILVALDKPLWDEIAAEKFYNLKGELISGPPPKTIQFTLDRQLAQELADNSSFTFDSATRSDVVVAEREVRS